MPTNTHTIIGGTKRFECRVVGHPRPEIRWFKDGREITYNSRYQFDHDHDGVISMIIQHISHKDQGSYRCRAENTEGIASTSAYLLVKAHKEHPDEEIEEVHTMHLEEHFVSASKKDRSRISDIFKEETQDQDAARKRTFEQIVDSEKEISREVLNGSAVSNVSSKKSSESNVVLERVEESSYSKMRMSKYEESDESSITKKAKSTSISSETSLSVETSISSEQRGSLQTESAMSKSSASEEMSASSVEASVSSSGQKVEGKALSMSALMEETSVTSKMKSRESELIIGASVEIEQSSSSASRKEKKTSMTGSVETDSDKTSNDWSMSAEVTEEKTSMKTSREAAGGVVASVEVEEQEKTKDSGLQVSQITTETSEKSKEDQRKLKAEVEVEEVPEECRMELQGVSEEADLAQTTPEGAPASLCTDSGFMESSMVDSSQFQASESMLDIGLDSTVEASPEDAPVDSAEVSTFKDAEAKAKSIKEVTMVEESQVEESVASEISDISSVVEETEISAGQEKKENAASSATVSQQASHVKEVVEDTSMEDTSVETAPLTGTTAEEQADTQEEIVKRERTSTSQEVSHAEETTEKPSEGDITGLLDEKPDPVTVVEEQVLAEEDQQEQRARWVDQITSRTETLTIQGEGKKVDELKVEGETAEALEKQETQAELSQAATQNAAEISVDVDTLAARQASVVDELAVAQEQVAVSTQETSVKGQKGFEENLEVDEDMSAQNVLGLQRAPTQTLEGVESSVDAPQSAGKEAAASAMDEGLTVAAQVDTEELKVTQPEEELKVSAETSVSDSKVKQAEEQGEVKVSAETSVSDSKVKQAEEQGEVKVSAETSVSDSKAQQAEEQGEVKVSAETSVSDSKAQQAEEQGEVKVSAETSVSDSKAQQAEEQGEVKVSAETSVSDSKAQQAEGEGPSAPRVLSVADDVAVELGQVIRLVSQVQGNPRPDVKWFKEGDTVKPGQRIMLQTEEDLFTLEISDATPTDGGTYTLTAHNSEGTIFSDVLVTVNVPPSIGPSDEEIRVTASLSVPEFVMKPGNVIVKELGTLELVCTIRGSPSPSAVWSRDGKTLESDSHVSIFESEGQYYLQIPRVSKEDGGDYTCTASNSEGSVSCTISVSVESQESSTSPTDEGAAAMVPLSQRESSSDELFLRIYEVIRAYQDEETKVLFVVGDVVEVLDSKQKSGLWLVRSQIQREQVSWTRQVCFIPSSHLKEKGEGESDVTSVKKREPKQSRSPTNRLSSSEQPDWIDTSEDEDRIRMREKYADYMVIADFTPPQVNGETAADWVKVTEGQVVEVMDMERSDRWLVQTRPTKTSTAKQGWVPSAYLEPKTTSAPLQRRSTREVFREDVLQISNKQQEALLKRSAEDVERDALAAKYAVTELVESEREYVRDLKKLLDSYYKRLGRRSTPSVLKDKRDLIFSNINDIMDFHTDVFLKILEASVANPGTIGDAFLVKERKFSMYTSYWIDHLATKVFVETEEAQEFLREYSRSIGDSELTFPRLLEGPISRIASYQTLLKDILRYTARAGDDCSSLEKAIAMLADIEVKVKHHQLLQHVDNLPGDVSSLGQLVRHDDVILWDSDASVSRGKERHLFLFKDKAVVTKRKKGDFPTDQPTFVFKGLVELQNVQVNENVSEDERRFELWYASATSEKYTIQTRNLATKQAWLKDTRELLTALGVEETDIMPEKKADISSTPATPVPTQKKKPAEKTNALSFDSESDSDRTLTDGDYASLSSYDSDISSYHTAPEFEDGTSRPIFKKRPKKTVCQEGSTVKFECIVGGSPLPTVRWLKDGAAIKESEQVQVTSEGDTSALTLLSVVSAQAGQYAALAANLNGSILSAADLVVLEELGLEKPEPAPEQETRASEDSEDKTPTEKAAPTPIGESQAEPAPTPIGESQAEPAPTPIGESQAEPAEQLVTKEAEAGKSAPPAKGEDAPDSGTQEVPEPEPATEEQNTAEPSQGPEEKQEEPAAQKKEASKSEEPEVKEQEPKEKAKDPAEELSTGEPKKDTEEAVKSETEPVVEKKASPEDKKAEDEKPSETEPTPVEEKKAPVPVDEEAIAPESKKVEEEVAVPSAEENKSAPQVSEEKKPIAEETVVPETKKVEEESTKVEEDKPKPEPAETKKPTETETEEKPEDKKPVVEEKEPVAEEKLFAKEKPVVEEKPAEVEEKPAVEEEKAIVEEEPVHKEKKPTVEEELVKEKKPTAEDKPLIEDKEPIVEEELTKDKKPTVEEKPVVEEKKPVVEEKPVAEEKPAVEEEPLVKEKKPVVEEKKPVVEEKPAVKEEPVVEEKKPVVEEKPAVKEKPVVEEKPVAEEEPLVKEKKPVVEEKKPVVEEKKPVVEEKPAVKEEPVVKEKKVAVEEKPVEKEDEPEAPEPATPQEAQQKFKPIPETAEGEVPIRAPHYLSEMNDVVVELGQLARFDCRVAAYPDPEITWLKDGCKVIPTGRYVLQNFHDDIFSLLIKDVKTSDGGCYKCVAKNEYGEASTQALLSVLALKDDADLGDMAPSFATKFGNVECIEGVPVEFTCQIKGRPPPTITWLLNGREVTPSLEILTRQKDDTIMLAFRSAQMEHSGDVVCKLKNHLGEASCRAKLRVNEDLSKKGDIPLFEERPSDLEVMEGGEAKFECVITGFPEPEVLWFFNGRELFESRRRVIRKKGDRYQLILREVIPDNAGVYTCKAVNAAGDASCAVELAVKEIPKEPRRAAEAEPVEYSFPPTFTRRLLDQRVAPGRTARFECLMLGIPLPDVQWQKDGQPLEPSNKLRIGREGSTAILEISEAESQDAGEYTCILTNDSGKATSRAGLTVQEERRLRYATPKLEAHLPPTVRAPSRGREELLEPVSRPARELSPEEKVPSLPFDKPSLLDVRDTSVKLTWLPARTTGLPENARRITYTVEAREMPSNRWIRLDSGLESTSYVARNLRPEKEYMFRVYAENKYGPSEHTLPATLPSREEPEEKKPVYVHEESPAPVQFPSTRPFIMDIGAETMRLGWKPAERPRRLDQPPVSYRVEAQKLPSEEWIPLASRVLDTSLYLSDLEPDRDYNVRVRAQGPYGVSAPTAPVWLPRATGFTGVPVSRPQITELEPHSVRLQWRRVDIPSFAHEQDPLTYLIEMQEPPSYHWREVAAHVPDTYYVVQDLEPATDYRFRVRAQNREGLRSEPSPATSVYRTLALSRTPIDYVEVTDYEPEYQTVGLSWRRVEVPPFDREDEPLLYMIECQEPQSESWRPLVSGVPTTRYRIPDVGPTSDYNFRVRALTPYGLSPPSHATGLYRSATPSRPLASDLFISSMEPENMRLSWQPLALPSSRATTPTPAQPLSYQVEALEYPGSQWRSLASGVRDTSYQLTGLAPDRDYSFRVRAMTPSGGLTDPTSPVTVTSLPVRPRLPSSLPVIKEMGSDSVRLQWPRAELPYYVRHTTPITYSVEMSEVPGYTWTPVRRGIPETSYTVTGLRSDRDYRFRIRPETEFGPGEYSMPVQAYRKLSLNLPAREPFMSNISPSSVTLSWLPAQLPKGAQTTRPLTYRIEMREPPSGHWIPVAERVPATTYTINFLNPDKDYAFRVFAELDGVQSEPTSIAYLPHRMGPPKMLREPPYISSVHPDSVLLAWRSVDIPSRITDYAPVTYRIEAQEPPSMEWRPVARHIPTTHYHLTGLKPGHEYSFRVRAENDIGLSEPTPSVLLRKRAVAPLMPRHEPLISDVSPSSLRLSWRPAEVPSYLLDSVPVMYSIHYQHLPDLDWHPLARRVAGTSYYVTGLSPDNNYTFRVQAENQFGPSEPTLPARMPRLAEIPAPIYSPEIEEVEPSALRLAWKTPRTGPYKTKKTTYAIETLEPSTWTWRPLATNLTTPTYRVSTLSPTHDYVFRVRAEAEKVQSEPSFPISYSRTRAFSGVSRQRIMAPPSVPVERPILSEIEADSVVVSWHPVHYPTLGRREAGRKYKLEMRELPYGSWASVLPQTPKWTHEVTGLRPNMDYAFRVSAITDAGTSEPSTSAYLYRRPVIPRTPLELPELTDVGDDAVSLRWKRVDVPPYEADDEPLSFLIEAQRLPSYEWEPVARGITDTNYRISGLQPRQDYLFRVRGELPSGVTSPSVSVPLYRRPERAGVPISYVTVDDRGVPPYSARIRWKPVYLPHHSSPASTLYQVEMRETPQREWQTVGRDIKGMDHLVSDLSPRKTYMFRVRAKTPSGDLSEPSMPTPFYPVYSRVYDSQAGHELMPISEDFSIPNRPYINTLIIKVPPRMHIEKPDMYSINPTAVHLTWNAARVPSATSQLSPTTYRVEVREDGTFNWVEKASNITGLGCDIGGLDPLADYAFRVRAVNDFGWSEATLPAFLHRPISLTYDEPEIDLEVISPSVPPLVPPRLPIDSPRLTPVSGDSVKLSWQPARIPAYARKSPISYSVEMKDPSTSAWSPLTSKLGDTSYQVTGLEPTRPYMFRVRAESDFGSSDPTLPAELSRKKPSTPTARSQSMDRQKPVDYDLTSRRGSFIDSISTGVPPRVPAGRPTINNATETSLTLSWPASRLPPYLKNTKLDYIIEYKEATSRLWANLAENVGSTSYKVTGLDPEQEYMFRVRAHNESGTSEPTLPATLERPKKKAATPQRRGSSVERRSLDRRSGDRMSERRSLSRTSLDRRSESRLSRREGGKKDGEDLDTLPGMSPEDSPQAPEFSSLAEEAVQYGVESHPMTISLHLRGYPPPQVTWYLQGKKLELGDRYDTYVTPTGQVFLEFLNMGWEDIGDYRCVAENELGTAERTVKIDVADPPTFIEPLHDITVVERGQGLLDCSVDGIPYPTVRFMKDWRPMTDTSRLVVTSDPQKPERWTMAINEAIPTDSGSYMCVAENVAGKIYSTSRVNVEGETVSSLFPAYKDSNLEDNYYVLEEIGRGRHGRVRRVIEKSSGKEYAAKFIQVREAVDKEFFRTELDMLCRQKWKNIVSVHEAYETPRQLIIVMELLDGGELLDSVVSKGQWTEGQAAGVVKQLLETLQHVHAQGIVHMDIKPSNLLLSGTSVDTAKLIDFGLARKLTPSQDTFLNHGTPGFASPEALDVKPISSASDVWGVGVLAYILLGGQSPFQADTPVDSLKKTQACDWSFDASKSFSSVSKDAKDFISKILKKNPDDRPTVDECLAHPWLKKTDGGAKVDVSLIKAFQDQDKKQRRAMAARTVAYLRTLQRQMTGGDVMEKGLRPAVDPSSGSVSFPDTEAYGEFLDSESWYEWQSRYGQGPDSGLLPLKDPEYTARIRGYKRSIGSFEESSVPPDEDEDASAAEREKYKMMKERRLMADIDKEEIPPSLEKELQWLEERKQARKAREPQRQGSVDSRRSSISTDGEATGPVPVFRQRLQDLTFETGDTITMYAALEGPPPYSTVWYRNEELLSDGSRVKQELYEDGQATLTITAAKPYDAGVYKCVARSKSGRASSRMRLVLGDVPERPGRPAVVQVASQELVLLWEAPRFDGNCPILYYRVDYKAAGDARWTTCVYTPLEMCLVAGLKPETPYRLRVSAANLLGRGPFSWSSVQVTTKKQGSISALTVGDLPLDTLKQRQEEGKDTASKPREREEEESPVEPPVPTLQTTDLDKEYAMGDTLWKGQFGQLKECSSKKTSKRSLVRCIPTTMADHQREFEVLKTVRHETVLRLLSAFCTKDTLYLVMEDAAGEHAAQRLSLRRRYSEDCVAYIIRQALYGLQYLHRNSILHLNLQPSALMLTSTHGLNIKLSDFSLARVLTNGADNVAVPRQGYPDFLAPEVVVKDKASPASDVWAVGTLTFLLLSGLSPFSGSCDEETLINVAYSRYDAGDLLDGVSTEALKFLYKVMKRLPRNRPSAQECLEHKWLQLTDAMMKTRESNFFRSNRLRQFVLKYDARRQSDDHRIQFDDLVLPPELAAILKPDVLTPGGQDSETDVDTAEEREMLVHDDVEEATQDAGRDSAEGKAETCDKPQEEVFEQSKEEPQLDLEPASQDTKPEEAGKEETMFDVQTEPIVTPEEAGKEETMFDVQTEPIVTPEEAGKEETMFDVQAEPIVTPEEAGKEETMFDVQTEPIVTPEEAGKEETMFDVQTEPIVTPEEAGKEETMFDVQAEPIVTPEEAGKEETMFDVQADSGRKADAHKEGTADQSAVSDAAPQDPSEKEEKSKEEEEEIEITSAEEIIAAVRGTESFKAEAASLKDATETESSQDTKMAPKTSEQDETKSDVDAETREAGPDISTEQTTQDITIQIESSKDLAGAEQTTDAVTEKDPTSEETQVQPAAATAETAGDSPPETAADVAEASSAQVKEETSHVATEQDPSSEENK